MQILIIGLIAAVVVILAPRFFGRRQERMLEQYEVLEKRFGFARHVSRSKWGKGIGEHHRLSGKYRGYPVSLYGHFHKSNEGRHDWTSLAFETLFAEVLEIRIQFASTQEVARFSSFSGEGFSIKGERFELLVSDSDALEALRGSAVVERLEKFAASESCGAISLSKGFLEYRETGAMEAESMRLRFQEALLLLAELADAISLFASRRKAKSGEEA